LPFNAHGVAPQLGFVNEEEFDRVVDPAKMVKRYVVAAK
jgi:fumarate hydratase class II